jgi:phage-related protein (TIGR01555 family)
MGGAANTTLLNKLIDTGDKIAHADSWFNLALGYGTARDKTQGSFFYSTPKVEDEELRSLYAHNDIAAKIVNIYPREAMRNAYALTGFDADINKKAEKFIAPWNLKKCFTDWWIWSRLFGGGATWVGCDDGAPPDMPIGTIKRVTFLRYYDRRWLQPHTYYKDGPKVGEPETYMLMAMNRSGSEIGILHESRLLLFGGARTEVIAKRELNSWDYSVLQVVHDALRSEGSVWKSTELLITDANQAVFKIKNLWQMMATKKGEELRTRVTMMDLMRSVSRAILLDKDAEEFERKPTNFTGLPELTDRSIKRVASAAEIPVTVLWGESPAGLNATGASDLQWFFARIRAEQEQYAEPNLLRLHRMLFSQQGSPLSPAMLPDLALKWLPLWEATAKERAEIYNIRATANVAQVNAEIVLPEEVAVSEYGGEDGGELHLDVSMRQRLIDMNNKKLSQVSEVPEEPDDSEDTPTEPGKTPLPGEAPKPVDPPAELPPVADPNAQAKDPSTALNGAQVTALLEIVKAVAAEELPRDSGVQMIIAAFPISLENAEKIMGEVGKTFEPAKPAPAQPFGAPPLPSPPPSNTEGEDPSTKEKKPEDPPA